jgi:DNA-binding response OmpR family regulator
MRILIIHDRSEVATVIHQLISAETDCNIDIVENVFRAQIKMRQYWYDLAIVDLTLPIGNKLPEAKHEYAEARR